MAGDRSTKVSLEAEVSAFIADMERAGHAAADVAKQVGTAAQKASAVQKAAQAQAAKAARESAQAAREQQQALAKGRQALDESTRAAAQGALAVGAAIGLTAKAAIDWETAWTGVAKTVDGSDAQLAAVEGSLREMARTLPATHDEIAAVAEAAGQLGVSTGDIAGFTETMIKLGETTNLTADEAATSIAQISNVMGTMDRLGTDGVDRFAAALVELGNNGASTERDILNMASRIAGAAKVVGMTEADLLAVSNALSSVGVEAEAGGTAFSNVLIDMSKAVSTGSDDLARFAEVAGMSADDFAVAFQERPAAAVDAFVQGLGRIQASGGDVFTTLSDLGQSDVRVSTALLKMAGAGDLLTQSLDDGTRAFDANSAAEAEFAKRAETSAAKMQVARNNIRDAAITIGDSLVPMVAAGAQGLAKIAEAAAAIPAPIRNAGLAVAGVASAGVLAAAGIGKVVDVAKTAGDAFEYIGTKSPRAASGMRSAANAAALAGKAFAALAIASAANDAIFKSGGAQNVDDMALALGRGSAAVDVLNQALVKSAGDTGFFVDEIDNLQEVLDGAFNKNPIESAQVKVVGGLKAMSLGLVDLKNQATEADRQLSAIDDSLAALVSGGQGDQAAEMMRAITEEAGRQGISVDELANGFPKYAAALSNSANEAQKVGAQSKDAASGLDQMSGSMDESASSAQDAAAAIDDLASSYADLGAQLLGQRGSAREFQAAIDDATAAVKENGKTLNINSEAGRANQAALDGIAEATGEWAARSIEAGASQAEVAAIVSSGRAAFIEAAVAMGMSAEKAGALATQLDLVPEAVSTSFEAAGIEGEQEKVTTYTGVVDGVPQTSTTTFSTPGSGQAQEQARLTTGALGDVPKSSVTQFSTPGSTDAQWQSGLVKQGVVAIPKSWSTHLSVSGASAAAAEAWRVKASLDSIPRTVWSSVIVSRISRNIPVEDGGILRGTPAGAVKAYAGGGIALGTGAYVPRVPQILSGTGGVLWQEPVTNWEAYISGKPGMERRNLRVWADAGRMLGIPPWVLELARVQRHFADGGMSGSGQAPAAMGGFPDAGMVAAAVERAVIAGMAQVRVDGKVLFQVQRRQAARRAGAWGQ